LPLFQGRPAAGKLENRGDEFKAVAIIQRFAQTDLVEQASQAAEKVGRFVGRGFSHDIRPAESVRLQPLKVLILE
jgi:hypothetical protein